MTEADWRNPDGRALMVRLSGRLGYLDAEGHPLVDDDFRLLMNAGGSPVSFVLPPSGDGVRWQPVIDTAQWAVPDDASSYQGGDSVTVTAHSLVLLKDER